MKPQNPSCSRGLMPANPVFCIGAGEVRVGVQIGL